MQKQATALHHRINTRAVSKNGMHPAAPGRWGILPIAASLLMLRAAAAQTERNTRAERLAAVLRDKSGLPVQISAAAGVREPGNWFSLVVEGCDCRAAVARLAKQHGPAFAAEVLGGVQYAANVAPGFTFLVLQLN